MARVFMLSNSRNERDIVKRFLTPFSCRKGLHANARYEQEILKRFLTFNSLTFHLPQRPTIHYPPAHNARRGNKFRRVRKQHRNSAL